MMIWSYLENQSTPFDPSTAAFQPSGTFYKDVADYCALAKVKVHPCLREIPMEDNPLMQAALVKETLDKLNEETKKESEQEEEAKRLQNEVKVLSIYTKRLDKNSIYALQAALPTSQVHTMRFSNNGFTFENCELLLTALAGSNVSRLFFDWNPLPVPKRRVSTTAVAQTDVPVSVPPVPESLFPRFLESPKLEYLYLRANGIADGTTVLISEKLAANTTLKCLDLSMNSIGKPGIIALSGALRKNSSLELLGLGSMGLTLEDLLPLFAEFGKTKLSEEEAKELKARIKERDAIVEKNRKLKGKKEEPVPRVNRLEEDDKGNSFEVRKEGFKHLNIGLNKLDDAAIDELDQLLRRTEGLVLTIASKQFSKEAYRILGGKYEGRVVY